MRIPTAVEDWNNILQEIIDNLPNGMRSRLNALLQIRGGNTRY